MLKNKNDLNKIKAGSLLKINKDVLTAYQFFTRSYHSFDFIGLQTFSTNAYETLDNVVEIRGKYDKI